ncbi:hypothetical protein like AT2G35790 [Hibiscus trionum]|uniref:Uncharacterized protein n=1 Tax=Hibiscus trionum TaxID=183268 RepID=A0A9W7JFN5_HIBTR|nr:hypothetical protein like AT2G35790 [Hibiscus trionum]
MARTALFHLLRSQSKQLISRNIHSAYPCRFATRSVTQYARPNLNSAGTIFSVQKRWASQAKTTEGDNKISIGPQKGREDDEDEKDAGVVYYGPISSTIKKVKMLSLSTCCLSVS